jgi:hypothetical protein
MPKNIMELTDNDCRFVVGHMTYCAERTVAGTSWCEEHYKQVFVKSKSRPRPRYPIALPVDKVPVNMELPPDDRPELPDVATVITPTRR